MYGNHRRELLIPFSTAFAFIVYEVFLSRFYSVILDTHFVFMTVALATLGIGLGGWLAYRSSGVFFRYRYEGLGVFGLLIILSVFVMYILPYQSLWLYAIIPLLPFLMGGALLAAIMQGKQQYVNSLYFSDLAGAGIGAIGSIVLMNGLGVMETIDLLVAVLVGMSFAYRFRTITTAFKIMNSVILLILVVNVFTPFSSYLPFRAYHTSPTNLFLGQTEHKIIYTEWNSFARTDVFDVGDGQLLYLTIDGGAVSPISRFTGDFKQVDYLLQTTSALAFQDVTKERALIIGAGGGQEVLTAKMAGFKQIEAVDINAGSFRAVEALSDFAGDVFQRPGVKKIVADGRNYIRQTKNLYDVIYLSLVKKNSDNTLGMNLTENYIFTEEALGEYLEKLKPNGRLAFLLHQETELAKLLAAAELALYRAGEETDKISNHFAVIGTYQHLGHQVWGMGGSQITRPLLIIQKQPFSTMEANQLKGAATSNQQIPIHIPNVHDQWVSMKTFLAQQNVNFAENRDDRPFFYHAGKISPLWIGIMVFVVLLVLLLVTMTNHGFGRAFYFSGIAIGFMMIETTLIERLILPLGHPTWSFVLVLGVVLLSGGIGSLVSNKGQLRRNSRYIPLLLIPLFTTVVHIGITWYQVQMLDWSLPLRIGVAVLLLFPLGFWMGMPFPYGISVALKQYTALSWAINGLMTVVGSILSVVLSLIFGFSFTMMIGALIYLLLYLIQPKLQL